MSSGKILARFPVLFIGSVGPDTAEYRTPAFSRAGNLAQHGLVAGLRSADVEVSVLSFQAIPAFPRSRRVRITAQKLPQVAGQQWLPFINVPVIKQLSLAFSIFRQGARTITRDRPRVLMSYNVSSFIALPLMALSRLYRVAYVPVIYDVDVPGGTAPDSPHLRSEFRIMKWIMKRLSGAVVGARLIATELLDDQPHLIVEGGLSEAQQQQYAGQTGQRDQKTPQQFNMIFAGALERYNGVDVMLDAMKNLPDPTIRLHLAGKGSCQAQIEQAAQRDPRIVFHRLLEMGELAQLYAEGSLLINYRSDTRADSRYCFPSKLIEYLASGVPVLCTRFLSLPDDYLPFLNLIEGDTPEQMASAIRQVQQNQIEANERAHAGQVFALGEKSWRWQGRRIRAFLETLV